MKENDVAPVVIIHNPGAGAERYDKEELVALLKQEGYDPAYLSTKEEGWKDFDAGAELLIVAGGDGTIRKVATQLLKTERVQNLKPVALLPLGTANNITKALGITGETSAIMGSWKVGKTKSFDVGRVSEIPKHRFFLESFGYGVFPYLMQEMKRAPENDELSPEESLQKALTLFHQIILSYEPKFCKLEVDGNDHSGKFLLAEIMNTPSIGPNLRISPLSDPGDGEFEVVLVPEQHKEQFSRYVASKIEGQEEPYSFYTLKGKNVTISWEGTHVHVDDQLVKLEKGLTVQIRIMKGVFEFLIP